MTLLKDRDRAQLRTVFEETIVQPVELALFTDDQQCPGCDVAHDLLTEVAALHSQITLRQYELARDTIRAAELGVDKAPGLAILGGADATDYGIRFYGVPSGYEFSSLIEAIRLVGSGDAELQPATRAFLDQLTTPLHLQVFVTPTCPYCPKAVVLAHRLAYSSPMISADMVEVMEFPELGARYEVMGVPRTVIADAVYFEGALPESQLPQQLKAALEVIGAAP